MVGPIAPFKGGISAFNTCLANAFINAGFNVRVVAWYDGIVGVSRRDQIDASMPVHSCARYLLKWYNPWTWLRAALYAAKYRPHLLVAHWTFPEVAPIYAVINSVVKRRSPHTKIVYIVHNATPHESHISFRFMEQLCFRNVSHFMVHANSDKKRLSEEVSEVRIYSGFHPVYDRYSELGGAAKKPLIDPDLPVWINETASRPVLLFFGFVKPYKGLDQLLEALTMFEEASLIVAGEFSKNCKHLRDQADSYGLSKRIFWLDRYVPDDEVAAIFELADVVALPYRSGSVSGIASIALAFGVPVVATDVGGLSECVQNGFTGYVVPPGDPQLLAKTLKLAYHQRSRLKKGISQFKEAKSWSRYCEILASWLEPPFAPGTKEAAKGQRK
ncbi:MAG: glycosyltransferase family 4 protein [Gammaproteobacteria bacterium]